MENMDLYLHTGRLNMFYDNVGVGVGVGVVY
jgi:hypothetical protein